MTGTTPAIVDMVVKIVDYRDRTIATFGRPGRVDHAAVIGYGFQARWNERARDNEWPEDAAGFYVWNERGEMLAHN